VQQPDWDRANDVLRDMMRAAGHDNECPGGLGAHRAGSESSKADDQGDGLRRTGIWDAGDGRLAWQGGDRFGQETWWHDGLGQCGARASEHRDQSQPGDAG
jgi:hypothetical protein